MLQPYFSTVNPRDTNKLFDASTTVKRERIVNELVASGAVEGLTQDHFWPFPQLFMPLHPDCGAIAMLACIRGRVFPMDHLIDIRQHQGIIAARTGRKAPAAKGLFMQVRAVLASARPGKRLQALRCLYGFFTGRGDHGLVMAIAEGFMDSAYQDEERGLRCTSQVWEKQGKIEHLGCMCSYGMQQ
jgi:hypothetical protein